jgi:hypothetical protein
VPPGTRAACGLTDSPAGDSPALEDSLPREEPSAEVGSPVSAGASEGFGWSAVPSSSSGRVTSADSPGTDSAGGGSGSAPTGTPFAGAGADSAGAGADSAGAGSSGS